MDTGQIAMAIAHLSQRLRWAKNAKKHSFTNCFLIRFNTVWSLTDVHVYDSGFQDLFFFHMHKYVMAV